MRSPRSTQTPTTVAADATKSVIGLDWRLALVEVLAFNEDASLGEQVVPSGFHLNIDANLDEEQQALVIPVRVAVMTSEDAADEEVMASVEVVCVFQFKDLEPARDEEGTVRLSRHQVVSALGIAISTARGVLIGRAKHPVFSRFVLPILSPRDQFDALIDPTSKPWINEE